MEEQAVAVIGNTVQEELWVHMAHHLERMHPLEEILHPLEEISLQLRV